MSGTLADDSLASAGQLRLTWLRFKRHRLAFISLFVVALFYLVAIFADFLAINDPHAVDARRGYLPPQAVHFFDANGFNPHVSGMIGKRDLKTFKQVFVPDPNKKLAVTLFAHGYTYDLFGLFEARDDVDVLDHLARAAILVRGFATAPQRYRFGLPSDEAAWQRLEAACATLK